MTIDGIDYQIDIIGKSHDTYTAGGVAPLTFQLHSCYTTQHYMEAVNDNIGGWEVCAMRTRHLPDILTKMPTEVQNGIREVNKLTSIGNRSTTVNITADKLFLLSEVEVFGDVTWSVPGEGLRYEYYKAGNSITKTLVNETYNNCWWERSPTLGEYESFCRIISSGAPNSSGASTKTGIAFGFCF